MVKNTAASRGRDQPWRFGIEPIIPKRFADVKMDLLVEAVMAPIAAHFRDILPSWWNKVSKWFNQTVSIKLNMHFPDIPKSGRELLDILGGALPGGGISSGPSSTSPAQTALRTPGKLASLLPNPQRFQVLSGGQVVATATSPDAAIAQGFEVRRLEEGGVVKKATLVLLGEAGPEAVFPLNGGGMGDSRVIHEPLALRGKSGSRQ